MVPAGGSVTASGGSSSSLRVFAFGRGLLGVCGLERGQGFLLRGWQDGRLRLGQRLQR